jgi:hypothetical protein
MLRTSCILSLLVLFGQMYRFGWLLTGMQRFALVTTAIRLCVYGCHIQLIMFKQCYSILLVLLLCKGIRGGQDRLGSSWSRGCRLDYVPRYTQCFCMGNNTKRSCSTQLWYAVIQWAAFARIIQIVEWHGLSVSASCGSAWSSVDVDHKFGAVGTRLICGRAGLHILDLESWH